ncbi:hypothetical protein [Paracoccus zhejiangensis]|uniref:hypothetical protein n=1 Tax=Paracoccus zhejiangensis TaxID=1077935 RepID=UPI0013000F16|nr:hypothetical protein [Paracoccus zhejiangensis]
MNVRSVPLCRHPASGNAAQRSNFRFGEAALRHLPAYEQRLWAGRAMSLCQDGHTACRTAA